jgi:probable rRNA maturation factor
MTGSMPSPRVEVLSDPVPGFSDLSSLEELVSRAAEAALAAEHTAGPDQVAVLLSDDDRLRDLNREFNGEDEVTDVLSFNETPGWHNGTPPAESVDDDGFRAPGEEPRLGDIVISLPQTKRQSEQHGVPFERELAMLTIHGVLHLLGYDHADSEEERVMFGKTDRILERVVSEAST